MKHVSIALFILVVLIQSAFAQFSGKVCYVTPSTETSFPAAAYSNPDDSIMINRLVSWGFTVDVAIAGNATAAGSFNNTTTPAPSDAVLESDYKLVVYSNFSSSNNAFRVRGLPVAGPYNTINLPVVALKNWFVKYGSIGFLGVNANGATTYNNTTANTVDFDASAPATFAGTLAGSTNLMLTSSTTEAAGNYMDFCVIPTIPEQNIIRVATVSGTTDQLIAWGAEPGTQLYNNAGVLQTAALKKRYAAVGVVGLAYAGMTTDGFTLIKNAVAWALEGGSDVEDNIQQPSTFALDQNYPNPFNPSTEISFTLSKPGMTTLSVFNVLGQKVATMVNQNLSAGPHQYTFDASRMTSGVYFYRLESGSYSSIKKMMLVK